MLASITPLGERGKNNRWGVTVAWYFVGSVLGGVLLNGLLGGAGQASRTVLERSVSANALDAASLVLLAVAAAVGLAFDLHVAGLTLPTNHRQVNERWLDTYRGWVYGFGFGVQLGLGIVTIVSGSILYLMLLCSFLSASWVAGVAIGAAFGLARAAPLLSAAHATDAASLRRLHQRSSRWQRPAQRAALGAQVAALGLATVLALGTL